MRRPILLLVLVASTLFVVASVEPAATDAATGIGVRSPSSLAPYESGVENERFGTAWAPRHADPGWRPFVRGRWDHASDVWTWMPDEDSDWAADEFGHWYLDASQRWLWVPGEDWARTWVPWR